MRVKIFEISKCSHTRQNICYGLLVLHDRLLANFLPFSVHDRLVTIVVTKRLFNADPLNYIQKGRRLLQF